MDSLYRNAISKGATEFKRSTRPNKRFMVRYNGRLIHFGSKTGKAFIDHRDPVKRKAWIARHSKIKLKSGKIAYKDKNQPAYWSRTLMW